MGIRIPIQADMTNFGNGNQAQKSIHHAESCPQNGNNGELFAGDFFCSHPGNRCFDCNIFCGKITGNFISHQHRNFIQQLPEVFGSGILIPHQRQLAV